MDPLLLMLLVTLTDGFYWGGHPVALLNWGFLARGSELGLFPFSLAFTPVESLKPLLITGLCLDLIQRPRFGHEAPNESICCPF